MSKNILTVAVAGNPNTGKSTLINAIAGTRLKVGNWPGVTVEKKTATLNVDNLTINLVDLPGTYSLSPYTLEEIIARDFLVKEKPDLVIDVVDSTNLERNLYLLLQILELGIPVIVALNIFDEAKKLGYEIDIEGLEKILGVKVIPTVATKGEGIKELFHAISEFSKDPSLYKPKPINYGKEINEKIELIGQKIEEINPSLCKIYPKYWLALKVLEGDEEVLKETGLSKNRDFTEYLERLKKELVELYNEDLDSIIAGARYGVAKGIVREVVKKKERVSLPLTEKIDKIVLNRFLGILIFLTTMWLVFKITFDFSGPLCDWFDGFIMGFIYKWVAIGLESIKAPEWLNSLILDGVIAGVGAVLVFVPLIGTIMFLITFLEGSGYLARAAFVIDRVMHTVGLHGKSFIPLLIGFGCNVPSIYSTRTLDTERDRKLTSFLVPCMSCGARLPVYVLFVSIFFAGYGATVIWSLYVIGILVAILLGIVLSKTLFKGEKSLFIMELPPYRMPTLKYLMIYTWEKLKHFLIKAGTFILASSIIVWILLNIPYGAPKNESLLAKIGKGISPIFAPLGFGTWEAASSLLTGIVAKEVVVSTMAVIYTGEEEGEEIEKTPFLKDLKEQIISFGSAFVEGIKGLFTLKPGVFEVEEEEIESGFRAKLQQAFTPLSAFSFLIFVLLYWPCLVFAFTMRAEFGWKVLGQTLLIYTLLPWFAAFIVYQGGKLIGF